MNQTDKATKRPWYVVTNGNPDFRGITNSTGKWCLATLSWPAGVEQAEWEANAALIVQAVNEHEALCAVAETSQRLVKMLEDGDVTTIEREEYRHSLSTLNAIRAKE